MNSSRLPLLALLALAACTAETSSPSVGDHFEIVQGAAQPGTPGRRLDTLLVVRLLDQRGVPMEGAPVTWVTETVDGVVTPVTSTTGKGGLAAATWTPGSAEGTQTAVVRWADGDVEARITSEVHGLRAKAVAVSLNAGCALDAPGHVWCWGKLVGHGADHPTLDLGPRPRLIDSVRSYTRLVGGEQHFCGMTTAGTIWCWGDNYRGALGTTVSDTFSAVPVLAASGASFIDIAASDWGVVALDQTGAPWRWGITYEYDPYPQGIPQAIPTNPAGATFTRIWSGYEHQCALATDGTTWCRGHGDVGQLGDSTMQSRAFFAPVRTAARFRTLTTGDHFSCGLSVDGPLWCWGLVPWDGHFVYRTTPRRWETPGFGALTSTYEMAIGLEHGQPWIAGSPFNHYSDTWEDFAPVSPAVYGVTDVAAFDNVVCYHLWDDAVQCQGNVPGYGWSDSPVSIPAP